MFMIIGKTIKGLFYLAALLLIISMFAGISRGTGGSVFSISLPSISVETRCDRYNSSVKCETNMR